MDRDGNAGFMQGTLADSWGRGGVGRGHGLHRPPGEYISTTPRIATHGGNGYFGIGVGQARFRILHLLSG
jgi:hypothetical protein